MRLGLRVGRACDNLHHQRMVGLSVPTIEVDELWSYIGKKQRRVTAEDSPEKGECYTFLALDRTRKAIISYRSGKRNEFNTDMFISDLRRRVVNSPMISSDALGTYRDAIRRSFGPNCDYGQVKKTYRGEPA